MAKSYEVGLIIKGDSKGGVQALKATQAELDRVNLSQMNAAGSASRFGKVANQGFMSISKSAATMAAGIAGTLISVKALTDGFQKVLSVGEQYERMQLRTEALIQATGGAAQLSSKQLIKLSEDVALNTLQSVEGVSKAVNVMQTFKSVSGTTFKQAIALSADLATVMGGDITSSAKQLGKALEDPVQGVTALREAGVTFTADQRNVIRALVETGKQAEAQKIILGELEKQVGGVGENEAKGLSGAYDTLAQRFDEFALALNNATGAGENWTEFVNRMARGLNFVTKEIKAANEEIDEAEKLFNKAKELQDKIEDLESAGTKMAAFKVPQLKAEREAILKLLDKELEKRAQLEQKQYDAYQAERQAKEDAAKLAQQAIRDQEEFNASVAEFDKAFARVEEEIRRTEAAEAALRKEREANIKANGLYVDSLEFEYEMLQLSDRERYIQINLRKLNADATEEEAQRVRELAGAIYDQNNVAVDYAKAWENAIERIDEAFADAWKGAFDSFEEFQDRILDGFDSLVAEIAHINFTKPLTDAFKTVGQGGGAEFSSLFGTVGSSFSQLFGGGSGVGAAAAQGKGGQVPVGADPAMGGSFLGQFGGQIGMVGGALLGNAMGGEYGSLGSSLGAMAGTAFFGPIGGLLGGLAGGALGGLFGGEESDKWQGATIDLSSGRITTQGETGEKFSQQNRSAADSAIATIAQLADAIAEQTGQRLTDEIKIGVGSRDGVDFALNGEDVVADQGDLSKVLESVYEYMLDSAGLVADVYRDLQRDGESLVESMVRVEAQFAAVTEITKNLELNFGLVGDTGKAAADAIVAMAGGLDAFVQKSDYYYNNFYSEQERLEKSIENYSTLLEDFNASMGTAIDDRGGLREFVDALDLTTEAGQAAYAAALDLAPALVDLGTAQERLAEITKGTLVEMEDAVENWGDAVVVKTNDVVKAAQQLQTNFASLSDVMNDGPRYAHEAANDVKADYIDSLGDAWLDYYDTQLDAVNDLIDESNKLKSITDSMGLSNLSPLTARERLSEAERQYQSALSSGSADTFASARQAYLSEASSFYAQSSDQYRSIFNRVNSDTSVAQSRLQTEITALNKAVNYWGEQTKNASKSNEDVQKGMIEVLQKLIGKEELTGDFTSQMNMLLGALNQRVAIG